MLRYKEVAVCAAAVLALSVIASARPNQNEMLVKATSAIAMDQSKLPWTPAPGGGVMYLPEINAFLVPAEALIPAAPARPHLTPLIQPIAFPAQLPVVQPPRRRRPVANFIKYINENFPGPLALSSSAQTPPAVIKKIPSGQLPGGQVNSEVDLNRFYGSLSYGSPSQVPLFDDLTPKIAELDRTLSENDRLLEKITDDLDETAMILMGQEGQGGTRLTLKPVAKAVAGPRGVAVASPIAQAVLRRKDPPPEITYEPDSVAVAGPGGQAYSHPKLIVTYIDDLMNSTDTNLTKEADPEQVNSNGENTEENIASPKED